MGETLDGITEVRVGALPLAAHGSVPAARAALTNPAALWGADATIATLRTSMNPTGLTKQEASDALRVLTEIWRGADAPTPRFAYNAAAGGQGDSLDADQYSGRRLVMPCSAATTDSGTPKQIDILGDALFKTRSVLVGFRREVATDSRYLIAARYDSGFDRRKRGRMSRSRFNLGLRSEWPWLVSHNTAATTAAYTFTPDGVGDIAWGVYWSAAIVSPLTVTVTTGGVTTSATYTWTTSPPASGMVSISFPFAEITGTPTITNTSGFLPPYLTPGTEYTITATGCNLWWLRNHRSI